MYGKSYLAAFSRQLLSPARKLTSGLISKLGEDLVHLGEVLLRVAAIKSDRYPIRRLSRLQHRLPSLEECLEQCSILENYWEEPPQHLYPHVAPVFFDPLLAHLP